MIKWNESDVDHIVFEKNAKIMFKFLGFILFLVLKNSSNSVTGFASKYEKAV